MEIIIEKPKKTDVIYLDDIDQNKHIVVGIDDVGRPIYFTPLEFTENDFKALVLNCTNGNSFRGAVPTDLKSLIAKKQRGINPFKKLAAFEKKDIKAALQWLVDNLE